MSNHNKVTPQEFINENKCEACAKGSIFCSWVGNFNKVDWRLFTTIDETVDSYYPKTLLKVFPRKMLDNIEAAFEGAVYDWHYNYTDKHNGSYAVAFTDYKNLDEKLIAIMNNIIDNKGEFEI